MAGPVILLVACISQLALAEKLNTTLVLTLTNFSTPVLVPAAATVTSIAVPHNKSEDKADVGDRGGDGDGRGLLYKVKHLKSTHVVKVEETITKYFTCTASKPTYLPYCREHRALPAPLHRTAAPLHTLTEATSKSLQPTAPLRKAAVPRFLARVHHILTETYTETHIHTHTDYRSTVTLIYRGCIPHDAPKVPECPDHYKTHTGPFRTCLGFCEGHCRGLCDGNCFGSCEVAAARACSGDSCSRAQRIPRQLQAPCLGTCFGHCDGVCDGLCDSTCVAVPE
ncbi:uncharacterized protein LOC135113740 [Scylla paramamosain]|uniref:uncharacterized protein LOC135113740 n=1 Tax=Scylla paramamosain TaxID=85552 RepID=UPI003083B380